MIHGSTPVSILVIREWRFSICNIRYAGGTRFHRIISEIWNLRPSVVTASPDLMVEENIKETNDRARRAIME